MTHDKGRPTFRIRLVFQQDLSLLVLNTSKPNSMTTWLLIEGLKELVPPVSPISRLDTELSSKLSSFNSHGGSRSLMTNRANCVNVGLVNHSFNHDWLIKGIYDVRGNFDFARSALLYTAKTGVLKWHQSVLIEDHTLRC